MREELIKLAEEKGFKSNFCRKFDLEAFKLGDHWYCLWMCELQKWLRDSYNKKVCTSWTPSSGNLFEINYDEDSCGGFNLPEQALEAGLYKALQLIKT